MNQVAGTIGSTAGGIAGGALLGALDGPLPFGEMAGGVLGGAIGGKIGETIGTYMPKMRMAGDIFKKGLVDPISKMPPFTNPIVDPNPRRDPFAIY